ncbi:secretin N-terminal domain-containing protein [Candidatus Hydrogenedentota bacterium]
MNRFVLIACVIMLLPGVLARAQETETGMENPAIDASNDKVTLTVENADIVTVLKTLAVTSRVNIISGPDVSGTVSINLFDVSFDEALNSILGLSGYTYFQMGNIIYVTTESNKAELPIGAQNMEMRSYRIEHATPEEVRDTLAEFVSPAGKVVLSAEEKTIVVQDSPEYLGNIERLVGELDVPPRQVLITAKILDVSSDDKLNIGVVLERIPDGGLHYSDMFTSGFAQDLTDLPDGATGLFFGAVRFDDRMFLEALAEKADVELLAAPQLLALDGEEAEMIVGDRLGFRITTTTETSSLESVEFLDVGTQLILTPHIANDGLIRLEIHPKVSSGVISPEGLPSESTAEVTTTMLVRDGETVVIGGLLNKSYQHRRAQVPWLGDIPILGYFFGRNSLSDTTSELVVLITPRIVGAESEPFMENSISQVDEHTEDLLDIWVDPETDDDRRMRRNSIEGLGTDEGTEKNDD